MVPQRLQEDLYMLDDGRVRQFLILGRNTALLLDTGFTDSDVLTAVRTVTDAPLQVLLTHGDLDHAGGLGNFEEAWLHEKDWNLVHAPPGCIRCGRGHVLLRGLETSGHRDPGAHIWQCCFADFEKKVLFSGDSVQKGGPIYLFGSHRNLNLYIQSERKLEAMACRFETIYPCHHFCPVTPDYIGKNRQDAEALQAGILPNEPTPGMPCRTITAVGPTSTAQRKTASVSDG